MNFRDNPVRHMRFARTCTDSIRDACAVERFAPRARRWDGHAYIVPACVVALLVVVVLIAMERIP